MAPDDEQARAGSQKARGRLALEGKPVGVPTPREITDEAARKLRDNADSSSTPNIDPKEK